jgi:hypothetical protein
MARTPTKLSHLSDINNVLRLSLDVAPKKSMSAAFSSAVAKFQRVDAEGQGDIRDKKGCDNMAVEAVKVLSFSEENPMGGPRGGASCKSVLY